MDDLLETTSIKSHKNDLPWNSGHFFRFSMVFQVGGSTAPIHLGGYGALVTWDVHVDLDVTLKKILGNDQDSSKNPMRAQQIRRNCTLHPILPELTISTSPGTKASANRRCLKNREPPNKSLEMVVFCVGN